MDYQKLSDEDLAAENQKEMAIRTESGARSEKIIAEFSRRKQLKRAQQLVAGISPEELETIVQVATAHASAAGVGVGEEA